MLMPTPVTNPSQLLQQELMSPSQIINWFRSNGISVADWAKQNGFSPALVYAVMKGQRKCLRGQSHQIAVALGFKREISQS